MSIGPVASISDTLTCLWRRLPLGPETYGLLHLAASDLVKMDDRDLANWRAINAGDRAIAWGNFIGDPRGAAYLTQAGEELSSRMAADLTDFTGPGWLAEAVGGGRSQGRVPWLGRFSPPLNVLGGDQGAAGAFVELVRWWAGIASQRSRPGMAIVRRDLRKNVSVERLLHTLTQVRLGAVASSLGCDVTYEPRPGDLLIRSADTAVTVEVFSVRTPAFIDQQQTLAEEMYAHLESLARAHGVHFHGELPDATTDLDAWRARTAKDAATVGRFNFSIEIQWDGHKLMAEPGDAGAGSSMDGPTIQGEVGGRLVARARTKARQIHDAAHGWLWMENHGAIDLRAPVFHLGLAEQLQAYDGLLRPVFADAPRTLQGLTFSGAGRRQWPPRPAERTATSLASPSPPPSEGGHDARVVIADPALGVSRAISQPLALDRVRSSMHLARHDGPVSRLMWRLVEADDEWLDLTLADLGVVSVAGLIRPQFLVPDTH